jgi:alanyl-tRNA synthetase
MFTNAGMNQFKEFFLGIGTPQSHRVADTQKCLRVSGKHNDLEEVGRDTYHHTMFEMLGNWSFGDPAGKGNGYFKKEAISWAWELLTEVYGIPKENLFVTVFEGSTDADNLALDQEAMDFWKAIIPEDRILMGDKKDNFWEMGDQGPCGPCSEIHVDIRSEEEKQKVSGASLVNQDHPQVVEIWNLVFMQYNRKADGSLESLPAKHVDTGMGFERLCMVLQGKQSNYDTDVFTPIIREIEAISGVDYGKQEETDIAIRVIADHLRAVSFSIADGQLPSNTGAGYVIRRILRRAIRYGFTFLGLKQPFMHLLVKELRYMAQHAFPELKVQQQLIENVIQEEERSFLKTLEQGLGLLDAALKNTEGKTLSGDKAFELYDTFGFPIDLTQLIASEKGFGVDTERFALRMEEQKNRSRKATETSTGDWTVIGTDQVQEFVGYDYLETDIKIQKYRKVTTKKEGDQYQLVFNMTPFYAEGGGQVGDKGYLEAANGNLTYIIDTKRENNEIVHFAKSLPRDPEATFKAIVDKKQRRRTACNHTATHLLHQGLREILGEHVEQKGSAVHSKYLRFDFSHFGKVTVDELRLVENFVNARIAASLPLEEQRTVPMQQALDQGAMALFGEKYGDTVRTIKFGSSVELCGGTHVRNTNELWHFKIVSEGAVAAGIRRIEAITADATKEFYWQNNRQLYEIKDLLNNAKDPVKAVGNLQEENQKLQKQIEALLKEKAQNVKQQLKAEIETVAGVDFLAKQVDLDAAAIKNLCFELGSNADNLYLLFGAEQNGKALLSCYISKELAAAKNLNAGTIVRELGKFIQGGGGGQPFFATAGGKNPAGLAEALAAAKGYLE